MNLALALTFFALAPVGAIASVNPPSQKIQNSLWSAEAPRSVPLAFEFLDENLGQEKCDQFLLSMQEAVSNPRSATEIYNSERSYDARFRDSNFQRQIRIHLPSEYNLLSLNDVAQLKESLASRPEQDYFQTAVDGLVPDFDAPISLSVNGAFETFREKIGAPAGHYRITQESPSTILVNISDRGLYCDLTTLKANALVHLQAYAPMPPDAEKKYDALTDPLAKAFDKVFNKNQSLRRRAAMLGSQTGAVVGAKFYAVTNENQEALAEKVLDHLINFETVGRSTRWVNSFGEVVPTFESPSADFPIEVKLVPSEKAD